MQGIKYPDFLFRYRPVSLKNLEALRMNRLYFSSANCYDDPFDTFLHINIERIREGILNAFQNMENIGAAIDKVKSLFTNLLTEEQAPLLTAENVKKEFSQGSTEGFLRFALTLRDEVKKDTWSVCFSENGFNEALWLKYADQHRGFVQMYDLKNERNFLCGKQEKCEKCGIKIYGAPLYPMYYSSEPYDATSYAGIVMLHKMEELAGMPMPQQIYEGMGTGLWERERTTLVKKECHKYDEEWRMITACQAKSPIMMKWIPSAIILGLRMDAAEEDLVVSMAKETGIREIYKSYINSKNQLAAFAVYTS